MTRAVVVVPQWKTVEMLLLMVVIGVLLMLLLLRREQLPIDLMLLLLVLIEFVSVVRILLGPLLSVEVGLWPWDWWLLLLLMAIRLLLLLRSCRSTGNRPDQPRVEVMAAAAALARDKVETVGGGDDVITRPEGKIDIQICHCQSLKVLFS